VIDADCSCSKIGLNVNYHENKYEFRLLWTRTNWWLGCCSYIGA